MSKTPIKWHEYPKEEPPFPEGIAFYFVTEEYFDATGKRTLHKTEINPWNGFGFLHDALVKAWARIPMPHPYERDAHRK